MKSRAFLVAFRCWLAGVALVLACANAGAAESAVEPIADPAPAAEMAREFLFKDSENSHFIARSQLREACKNRLES